MTEQSRQSKVGSRTQESTTKAVSITVSNANLVTVRDAMRGLNRMVAQLQAGEQEQFVLMHRGRMVARIVPIGDDRMRCPDCRSPVGAEHYCHTRTGHVRPEEATHV